MNGLVAIIVGYQGAGKSCLVRSMIEPVHGSRLKILDVNNEYENVKGADRYILTTPKGLHKIDFDRFTSDMTELKETVFVIEDATTIFSHRGYDPELLRALIGKRHTKNIYLLLFHSLRVIPRDVFEYADDLYLLKTADTDDIVNTKFRGTGVTELLAEVRNLPDFKWSEKQKFPVKDTHYKILRIKKGKVDNETKPEVE
jgi:hypothetical protein